MKQGHQCLNPVPHHLAALHDGRDSALRCLGAAMSLEFSVFGCGNAVPLTMTPGSQIDQDRNGTDAMHSVAQCRDDLNRLQST